MALAFKGLIFDMDGVLVDSMPLHFQVWQEFAREHKLAIPDKELRHLVDARRNVEIFPVLMGRDLAKPELEELARKKERRYLDLADSRLREVPGSRAFLDKALMAGIPMGLATAASESNVSLVMNERGFRKYFRFVLTARDVEKGKPDPEVYFKAAKSLGLDAADCLVFEDALLGVKAAKAAGCPCLALTTAHSESALLAAGADWICQDLREIPQSLASRIFG
jgi:beta-phosphoglucomutase